MRLVEGTKLLLENLIHGGSRHDEYLELDWFIDKTSDGNKKKVSTPAPQPVSSGRNTANQIRRLGLRVLLDVEHRAPFSDH